MSKKQKPQYRKDVGHNTPHHFFTRNEDGTTTGTNLDMMIVLMKRAGKAFSIYRVPLAMFSEYSVTFGNPDVDGTVFIGHWGFAE